MEKFNSKYNNLNKDDFFEELTQLGNSSYEEILFRKIYNQKNFNDLTDEDLLRMRRLLKMFHPEKECLRNKTEEQLSQIKNALSDDYFHLK